MNVIGYHFSAGARDMFMWSHVAKCVVALVSGRSSLPGLT